MGKRWREEWTDCWTRLRINWVEKEVIDQEEREIIQNIGGVCGQ